MKYILSIGVIFLLLGAVLWYTAGNEMSGPHHMGMMMDRAAGDLTKLPDYAVAEVKPTEVVELKDGDIFDLEATIVKQEVGNRTVKRLAYNGQIPGPVIKVKKGAKVTVNFTNNIDMETAVHAHGLRGDWKMDGAVPITPAVEVGDSFSYELEFPDAGVYWYHPHVREDYQQELGLYGNFIVEEEGYWNDVEQEEYLIFDDILEDGEFSSEVVTNVLMGRFGDTILINDSNDYTIKATQGEVIRVFVTNVANTRTFDLAFAGAEVKLVGGDNGRIEQEVMIDNFVIAPAERYVVELLYAQVGTYRITHRGETVGQVVVGVNDETISTTFETLRSNVTDYTNINAQIEIFLAKEPDKSLRLDIDMKGMMGGMMMGEMSGDDVEVEHSEDGIEWEDDMAMMNQMSTNENIEWIIEDQDTGKKNGDIDWSFRQGDMVKVRIYNDETGMHPMQHPVHFHGQRFVVLATDGEVNDNLQWKDTVLIPKGQTYDLLIEMSNVGQWMAHCHIAEHLHSGMMFNFTVE